MICPNCQTPQSDDARFCCECGVSVTAFAPPDGFEVDLESLTFYRDDGLSNDGSERYYTWFDPDTGEYEQSSYHVEQPQPPEPAREAAEEPEPDMSSQSAEKPQADIPEGFTHDPSSGLYYRATPGTDPATGAAGEWYTWFYPDSGEYNQSFYPSGPAPQAGGKPDPDTLTRRGSAAWPGRNTAAGGGKQKIRAILIVLPLIALLCGSAFAFVQNGGLAMFMDSAPPETPEEIAAETNGEADMPVFTPAGDDLPDRGERESSGEETGKPETEAPEASAEASGGNWAALYADFIREQGFTSQEFQYYERPGIFPAHTPVDVTMALSQINFYEVPGFDYPVMFLAEKAELEYGSGILDTNSYQYLVAIRDGEAAWVTSQAEIDMVLQYEPGNSNRFEILGEALTDPFNFYGVSGDEEGYVLIENSFERLYDWLSDQPNEPVPTTRAVESMEASGYNWAALYADYLWDQGFAYQEFIFYQDMATFPVYTPVETTLAVMLVTFYDVEGFYNPVMELLAMAEMEGKPGVLDTSPYSDLYIIRDGEVTRELTSEENDLIVSYDDNTGMSSIRGSLITTYELHAPATGSEGSAMVDDNFAYLYDWLTYEAQRTGSARGESPASEPPAESPASEAAAAAPEMSAEQQAAREDEMARARDGAS